MGVAKGAWKRTAAVHRLSQVGWSGSAWRRPEEPGKAVPSVGQSLGFNQPNVWTHCEDVQEQADPISIEALPQLLPPLHFLLLQATSW